MSKLINVNRRKMGSKRDTPDLSCTSCATGIVSNRSMAAQFVFLSPSFEEATSVPWDALTSSAANPYSLTRVLSTGYFHLWYRYIRKTMSAQYHHVTNMRIAYNNQTKGLKQHIQTAVENNPAQYSRSDDRFNCDYFNKTGKGP